MLNLTSAALKVFLALDPCDMRKSFNGLHTLASDQLQTAPRPRRPFCLHQQAPQRKRPKFVPSPLSGRGGG